MANGPAGTRTLAIAGHVLRFAVETRREDERLAGVAAEEGRMLARLLDALADGQCFYDIGANIGTVTLPVAAARRGPCFAFEAEAANAARLARNSAINGLGNVTVVELAVWSEPSTVSARCGSRRPRSTTSCAADTLRPTRSRWTSRAGSSRWCAAQRRRSRPQRFATCSSRSIRPRTPGAGPVSA